MGEWLAHLWLWALMSPIYVVVRSARPVAAHWLWVVAGAAVCVAVVVWAPAVARIVLRVLGFILRIAIRGYFAYFCLLTGVVLPLRLPGVAGLSGGVAGGFATVTLLLGAAIWLIIGAGLVLSLPRHIVGGRRA